MSRVCRSPLGTLYSGHNEVVVNGLDIQKLGPHFYVVEQQSQSTGQVTTKQVAFQRPLISTGYFANSAVTAKAFIFMDWEFREAFTSKERI